MAPAKIPLTLAILLQLSSYALPQDQQISSRPTEGHPLEVGPVESCQRPPTTYCTEITYEVPASIAWLTEYLEYEIRNKVEPTEPEDDLSPECEDILKETLCKKKFPRCSTGTNSVFFETSMNCTDRLQGNCGRRGESLIKAGLCNAERTLLHSGSCNPLSNYDRNGDLRHCNLLTEDILVSDWMYQYILQVDIELQHSAFLRNQLECWEKYRDFLCSVVGQCVGDTIELINTRESCQSILNCYPDDISMIVSELVTCQPWPTQSQLRAITDPPGNAVTPASTRSPAPLGTSYRTWVEPGHRTFVFGSASRIVGGVGITVTALSLWLFHFSCFV